MGPFGLISPSFDRWTRAMRGGTVGNVLQIVNDMREDAPDGEYLRAGEAAALLNVSPKTVSRWADQGRIAHIVTLGGHRRFPRSEIDRIARVMTGEAYGSLHD